MKFHSGQFKPGNKYAFTPKMSEEEFNRLVDMVVNETNLVSIYDFVRRFYKDDRSVQIWIDKALKEAKLRIDKA
jgi:hypothetical protein